MASSISLPSPQTPLLKSSFLPQNRLLLLLHRPFPLLGRHASSTQHAFRPSAAFDLAQLLGGRGLCNGEQGLKEELKRNVENNPVLADGSEIPGTSEKLPVDSSVPEDGFEKELMGLTGGFPGGEKGLKKFISENPPPRKPSASKSGEIGSIINTQKPKPPDLPLLLPGMIAIVKNTNSPYYMYCGIVQRITDGKAGVLFEGGNWDRLITFRLEELERREKGPPMKNPKSAVLEPLLQKDSQ